MQPFVAYYSAMGCGDMQRFVAHWAHRGGARRAAPAVPTVRLGKLMLPTCVLDGPGCRGVVAGTSTSPVGTRRSAIAGQFACLDEVFELSPGLGSRLCGVRDQGSDTGIGAEADEFVVHGEWSGLGVVEVVAAVGEIGDVVV